MTKDKKHRKNLTADDALIQARATASDLKPKDRPLYWATLAQALYLNEIRDMMRDDRTNTGAVQLPDEAPSRKTADVTVNES